MYYTVRIGRCNVTLGRRRNRLRQLTHTGGEQHDTTVLTTRLPAARSRLCVSQYQTPNMFTLNHKATVRQRLTRQLSVVQQRYLTQTVSRKATVHSSLPASIREPTAGGSAETPHTDSLS